MKTENKAILETYEIPLIGGFFILLVSILPIPVLIIINGLFDLVETETLEKVNPLIAGVWNTSLTFSYKIRISIFFIPCWILFTVFGILRMLQII